LAHHLGIGVCVAAFGGWGVLDRESREREATSRTGKNSLITIAVGRAVAAVVGVAAALVTIFSVLGILLGTWIS
jgi:hypothetical protein